MLSLDEILLLDESTILRGADSNGNPYLPQMLKLYKELFNGCTSCNSKYPIYIQKLKEMAQQKQNTKATSQQPKAKSKEPTVENQQPKAESKAQEFLLKKDVLLPIFGTTKSYTADNITDEVAIKFLKDNPNRIGLFKSFPKDWKEQLNND